MIKQIFYSAENEAVSIEYTCASSKSHHPIISGDYRLILFLDC